jgi:ubiquinol-cytochrome c reductase cytochrome c1 subunit
MTTMKQLLPILAVALAITASAPAFAQDPNPMAPTQADTKPAEPAAAAGQAPGEIAPAAADGGDRKACEETPHAHAQHWPHQNLFGAYDKAAVQRGLQVYKEVCSACHSMKFLSYRDLGDLGYSPEQVKAYAAEFTVTDGPNEEGEMFERPARPSDRFKAPFANAKAARFANNGALPPDLSLIVKARHQGEDYIHALLTGYGTPPACADMMPGMNWNNFFPGHQIAMAPPLTDNRVTYADGTPATLDQEARDVAQFLAWASEPRMEQRKATGLKVLLFMVAFALIMGVAKRRVWSDVR